MLLGNYTPLSANPGKDITLAVPNPYKWRSSGNMYSFYTGDAVVTGQTDKSSFNNGYVPPYSWILSPKAGGLSSMNELEGTGTLSITSLSLGANIEADLAGIGSISVANLSLITSMAAALSGSGSLTASMTGVVNLACSLAGSGNFTAAMGALAYCTANLTGTGTIASDLRGKLWMSADIFVNQSEAEVQQIVSGVWEALAVDHNVAGTMGEKLNDAGSAGNPWATALTGNETAGTFGEAVSHSYKINKNRWKIENDQMTIYADDGTTPLFVFDLKDGSGAPTETNVLERDPV